MRCNQAIIKPVNVCWKHSYVESQYAINIKGILEVYKILKFSFRVNIIKIDKVSCLDANGKYQQ